MAEIDYLVGGTEKRIKLSPAELRAELERLFPTIRIHSRVDIFGRTFDLRVSYASIPFVVKVELELKRVTPPNLL